MDVVVFARLEEVAHREGSEIDLAGEPGHGVLLCRPRGVAGLGSGLREHRDVMVCESSRTTEGRRRQAK